MLYDILKDKDAKMQYSIMNAYMTLFTRKNKTPYLAYFELTPLCTLDCQFCYVHLTKEQQTKRGEILSFTQWQKIADEAIGVGVKRIVLTGGECMIYPDFKNLYRYIYERNTEISLISNCTLIDKEMIDFFVEYPPNAITISLYGFSEKTYLHVCGNGSAFFRVLEGIELLHSAKIPIQIVTTVTEQNKDDILEISLFCEKKGIPYYFNNILKANRECTSDTIHKISISDKQNNVIRKEIARLHGNMLMELPDCEVKSKQEQSSGMKCGAGTNIFHINWQGKMQPCPTFDAFAGDVINSSIDNVWNEMIDWAMKIPQLTECSICKHQNKCVSCIAAHWGDTQEFGKVSPRLCYKIQHNITD